MRQEMQILSVHHVKTNTNRASCEDTRSWGWGVRVSKDEIQILFACAVAFFLLASQSDITVILNRFWNLDLICTGSCPTIMSMHTRCQMRSPRKGGWSICKPMFTIVAWRQTSHAISSLGIIVISSRAVHVSWHWSHHITLMPRFPFRPMSKQSWFPTKRSNVLAW